MNKHIPGLILLASIGATCASNADSQTAPPAEPPPPPRWDSAVAVGLTLTSGNSDTLLFTGGTKTEKKMPKDQFAFGIDGAYGEDNGDVNNEMLHGFGQYNHLFTERFYGYARVDGLYDGIADLDYRFTLSPGAGYYFVKTPQMTLAGEAGPGYVIQKKGGEKDDYFTIRLADRFEYKFKNGARIWQSFEYLPDVSDFGNYVFNAEVGASAALTKTLALRIVFQDTYDSRPAPGRVPNDMKLVSGVEYKF